MTDASTPGLTANGGPTYAFEHVAARLEPFDLLRLGMKTGGADRRHDVSESVQRGRGQNMLPNQTMRSMVGTSNTQRSTASDHALFPIFLTNGLVFPYNPQISESLSVKYDAVDLTHTNESFHVYRGTDNTRINIGEAVWTCDTFDNAIYAMSVIHFFRTYSQMDFGAGRTGRPPSPMWFSAYGNYAFHRVPVLMEKADWTFPPDVDYVGIPEFGSDEYRNRQLNYTRSANTPYTWLPMKFTVSGITLVVQHSPRFWTNWNLDQYRSGVMVQQGRKSFHLTNQISTPRK